MAHAAAATMMTAGLRTRAIALLIVGLWPRPVLAQDLAAHDRPVTLQADVLFYGDNTEFSNPFREGETVLGNAARVMVSVDLGDRATLTGGAFGDRRYGSNHAFDVVRPVLTLDVRAGASRYTFGTFDMPRPAFGPDRGGPHRLLPPIQSDTLGVTRTYEAGLQWRYNTNRVTHETWLNWQRLNTAAAREVFDAGVVGAIGIAGGVDLGFQGHIVHHGGQLYANGPVGDSWAIAPGLAFHAARRTGWRPSFEVYGLVSRHVPDRERLDRATSGGGVFTRAALEHDGWRGHLIVWRGDDYIKEEGDPNYGALQRNGARFRKVRDYAELGLTRAAQPVAGLRLEGSARLHRVENHYEYSYRILGSVALSWRLR